MLISSWLHGPTGIPLVFHWYSNHVKGVKEFSYFLQLAQGFTLSVGCTKAQIVKQPVSHFPRGHLAGAG